jgi:hypothetical protein
MLEFIIHIRIKETLDEDWSAWFDGLTISSTEDGNTLLTGYIPDQAAVRGLFMKLWDLNLTILSFDIKFRTKG